MGSAGHLSIKESLLSSHKAHVSLPLAPSMESLPSFSYGASSKFSSIPPWQQSRNLPIMKEDKCSMKQSILQPSHFHRCFSFQYQLSDDAMRNQIQAQQVHHNKLHAGMGLNRLWSRVKRNKLDESAKCFHSPEYHLWISILILNIKRMNSTSNGTATDIEACTPIINWKYFFSLIIFILASALIQFLQLHLSSSGDAVITNWFNVDEMLSADAVFVRVIADESSCKKMCKQSLSSKCEQTFCEEFNHFAKYVARLIYTPAPPASLPPDLHGPTSGISIFIQPLTGTIPKQWIYIVNRWPANPQSIVNDP